jgi:hypothetical protein
MYVFSEEIRQEIDAKTLDICSLVDQRGRSHVSTYQPEQLTNEFKDFHTVSRLNLDVVRYFIKRREDKLFNKLTELKIHMPLEDHLDDKVWDYLQLMYLLYENAHSEPIPEIQVALLNRLEGVNKDVMMNSLVDSAKKTMMGDHFGNLMGGLMGGDMGKILGDVMSGDMGKMMGNLMGSGDMSNLMGNLMGGDMGDLMKNMGNDVDAPQKMMEDMMNKIGIKDVSSNPSVVTNILDEIKTSIKDSGKNVTHLLENTKKLGQKYQDKIKSGELSVEEMMGSLMGVLKDPNSLMNTMKDMDLSDLPDPNEMLGSLMGGSFDINGILGQVMGNQPKVDPSANIPLTEEQLKELEEFYSSLNIK